MKNWCYASGVCECKSCETANQIFFNVMFSFLKARRTGYDINIAN